VSGQRAQEGGSVIYAIEVLADKIARARELGLLPKEWDELAKAAVAEQKNQWLPERDFRLRTGASDKWCRNNFVQHETHGLARANGRKREWHVHARLPRANVGDAQAIKHRIIQSFEEDAS
jgi:hypothetical protein